MKTRPNRFPDKTVNESKIYSINWAPELKTDSVGSIAWSSDQGGLTFSGQSTTGAVTAVTIAGGNRNTEYIVTAKLTKATSGEICEAVARLLVTPSDEVS